ncbi:hypothetical protein Pve01_16160 [Planomonospora venezuelensis]|nr:hypothetical protein Pve01_16160 [Planomonospora venezuelensis]
MTQQYPEVRPDLPARSRGVIALVEENCTVCMLCARECPDWCIYIDSHKETLPAPEGGRPRARNVLDRFAIDFSLCMYCGICIEVCPFDALFWSPEFEYAEGDIRNLVHEKDRLAAWVQTVPPPPAHEPNADPPKELAAASRPARPDTPRPARARPASGEAGAVRPGGPEQPGAGERGAATGVQEAGGAEAGGAVAGEPGGGEPGGGEPGGGEPGGEPGAGRSAAGGPGGGEGAAGSRPARPERRPSAGHASVRAIRPPGALPKKPGPAPDPPSSEPPSSGPPSSDPPAPGPPSTGRPPSGKLSTDGGGAPPEKGAPEQTAATDPGGEPEEES